ncbi:MAG TPA: hypothetical protein VN257_00950 [Actinotalea sp.]|nr:hypothetical protein [Actinotalea sp.]
MSPVVVTLLVALVSAVVVLAVVARDGGSSRGLVSDLRSGLRRGGRREGLLAGARRDLVEAAETEPSNVEEIFLLGSPTAQDYVRADDLTEPVVRATQRAARGLGALVRH